MDIFRELIRLEREGAPAALCTVIEASGSVPQQPGSKMVVREDGGVVGTVGGGALEHEVVQRAGESIASGEPRLLQYDTVRDLGMACGGRISVFVDPAVQRPVVIVFGAGHIGRDLAAMALRAGFRPTVVDPRPEWADPSAFPESVDVRAGDPVEMLDELPLSEDAFVVLVSHSHAVDQRILASVLPRPWRYLGMIASKRKVKQVFGELEQQGADPDQLARVHSPIGLKIGGNDPGEIAVSILAELIRVRHDKPEDPATSFRDPAGAHG